MTISILLHIVSTAVLIELLVFADKVSRMYSGLIGLGLKSLRLSVIFFLFSSIIAILRIFFVTDYEFVVSIILNVVLLFALFFFVNGLLKMLGQKKLRLMMRRRGTPNHSPWVIYLFFACVILSSKPSILVTLAVIQLPFVLLGIEFTIRHVGKYYKGKFRTGMRFFAFALFLIGVRIFLENIAETLLFSYQNELLNLLGGLFMLIGFIKISVKDVELEKLASMRQNNYK